MKTILAISGSLRSNSSNNAVIDTAAKIIGDRANFTIYQGLGSLPHFNDAAEPPKEVIEFREMIKAADGVLICSPEYAFGVPGVLKNALDWTVTSGEFVYKPVALITAATDGSHAHASLLLTLGAITAALSDDTTLLLSFIRSKLDATGQVKDAATLQAIANVMNAFLQKIQQPQESLFTN